MEYTLSAKAKAWPVQPELSSAPMSPEGKGCPECQRWAPPEVRLLRGLARMAIEFADEMASLFDPFVTLADRHPRVVVPTRAAPSVAIGRTAAEAAAFITREIPLARAALNRWLAAQKAGSSDMGPGVFRTPEWTPLTAQLADLVVADCGPALSDLIEEALGGARIAIFSSRRPLTLLEQQAQLLSAFTHALAQAFRQGVLSDRLRLFLKEVRDAVTQWAIDHRDWRPSGAFAVSNILAACALRSVVSQLRQQAQARPATGGKADRADEAIGERKSASSGKPEAVTDDGPDRLTLLAWLGTFCLDLGSNHNRFQGYDLQVAVPLEKAHQVIKQYGATFVSDQPPIRHRGPTTLGSRLVYPRKGHGAARVPPPLQLQPPPAGAPLDSRRPTDSRPAAPDELTAADFLPGRLQEPDAPSPTQDD